MTGNKYSDTIAGGIVALCLYGALYNAYPYQVTVGTVIVVLTWGIARLIDWGM